MPNPYPPVSGMLGQAWWLTLGVGYLLLKGSDKKYFRPFGHTVSSQVLNSDIIAYTVHKYRLKNECICVSIKLYFQKQGVGHFDLSGLICHPVIRADTFCLENLASKNLLLDKSMFLL